MHSICLPQLLDCWDNRLAINFLQQLFSDKSCEIDFPPQVLNFPGFLAGFWQMSRILVRKGALCTGTKCFVLCCALCMLSMWWLILCHCSVWCRLLYAVTSLMSLFSVVNAGAVICVSFTGVLYRRSAFREGAWFCPMQLSFVQNFWDSWLYRMVCTVKYIWCWLYRMLCMTDLENLKKKKVCHFF